MHMIAGMVKCQVGVVKHFAKLQNVKPSEHNVKPENW